MAMRFVLLAAAVAGKTLVPEAEIEVDPETGQKIKYIRVFIHGMLCLTTTR